MTFEIVRGRILNRLTYILGKKGTKRKAVQDITNRTMLDSQLNKTANGADGDSAAGPSNEIDLNHYAPFFREWDLSVFKILTYKTVEIDSEPSEEEEYKNPKLRPPEFLMLMKDLNSKLEHMLVSSKTKKSFGRPKMKAMGFSNLEQLEPKGVINFMIPLLDHIFSSIEKIRDHFKKEIEINDNILDSSGITNFLKTKHIEKYSMKSSAVNYFVNECSFFFPQEYIKIPLSPYLWHVLMNLLLP